jgi:ribosomal protein L22
MAERKPGKDTEKKDAEKKAPAKKPAAKKEPAKKATATKSGSAAKATSKTADPKAAEKSKAPAKKETAKKPAAKKETAKKEPAKAKAPAKKEAAKEEPKAPVVKARARFVRVAPRKARQVADQVRGLPIEDARSLLQFSTRGAARDIAKLINSAAANAENNHDLIAEDLLVADITVDEGPTLRRYRPRALGRATRIDKRTSHIHVALTPED